MQGPGKQRSRQAHVDGLNDPKSRRDDLKHQLDRNTNCSPQPHHGIRNRGEHRERDGASGIVALPCAHRDQHQDAPDPRCRHDQNKPDVEPHVRGQRRIEGEEDRGLAKANWNDRHHHAEQRDPERRPGPWPAGKFAVERGDRNEIAKAHDEKSGKHIGNRDAMRRHRHEILSRRAYLRAKRAADPHLPGANHAGE